MFITELSDKSCIAVTCGHYHSLALSADQRVWGWGWGVHGQLGMGTIEDVLLPSHVTSLDHVQVTQMAAGYSHTAVMTSEVCFWRITNTLDMAIHRCTTDVLRAWELLYCTVLYHLYHWRTLFQCWLWSPLSYFVTISLALSHSFPNHSFCHLLLSYLVVVFNPPIKVCLEYNSLFFVFLFRDMYTRLEEVC